MAAKQRYMFNRESIEAKLNYLDRLNVLIGRGGFDTQSRINTVLDAIESELGLEMGGQEQETKPFESQREGGVE